MTMSKQWEPKVGERFWTISFYRLNQVSIWSAIYFDTKDAKKYIKSNDCFKTKKQAQESVKLIRPHLDAIKQILKENKL